MSYCPRSGCEICGLRTWVEILPGSGCVAPLFLAFCALSRSARRAAARRCPASSARIRTAIPMRRGQRRIPVRRLPVRRPRASPPWKASHCPRRNRPTAPDRTVPSHTVPNPTVPKPMVLNRTAPNTPHCSMTSPSTDRCNRRRRLPPRHNPSRPMRRRPLPFLNTRHPRVAAMRPPRRYRGLSIRRRQGAGPGSLMPLRRARRRCLRPLMLPQ
jgi:hypothetical protein